MIEKYRLPDHLPAARRLRDELRETVAAGLKLDALAALDAGALAIASECEAAQGVEPAALPARPPASSPRDAIERLGLFHSWLIDCTRPLFAIDPDAADRSLGRVADALAQARRDEERRRRETSFADRDARSAGERQRVRDAAADRVATGERIGPRH